MPDEYARIQTFAGEQPVGECDIYPSDLEDIVRQQTPLILVGATLETTPDPKEGDMESCRLLSSAATLAVVLASAAVGEAQQGISEVRGRVVDAEKAILPGVVVTVTNQDIGIFREVSSNADGTYFVSGIVPAMYEVAAVLASR